MRFRVGIADIAFALTVLVVLILPDRQFVVAHAYPPEGDRIRDIAYYQTRLTVDPGDGQAAARLAELLVDAEQTDWAARVAGHAAATPSPTAWRALLATSASHAERLEIDKAQELALRALQACRAAPEHCPNDQAVRLTLYFEQLDAGLKSGIDPRLDPQAYYEAVNSALRTVRLRAGPTRDPAVDPE